MEVRPATIAQIADLAVNGLIDQWTLDIHSLLLHQLHGLLVLAGELVFLFEFVRLELSAEELLLPPTDLSAKTDVLLYLVAKVSLKLEHVLRLLLLLSDHLTILPHVFEVRVIESVIPLLEHHIGQRVTSRSLPLQILLIFIHLHDLVQSRLGPLVHTRAIALRLVGHVLLRVFPNRHAARRDVHLASIV